MTQINQGVTKRLKLEPKALKQLNISGEDTSSQSFRDGGLLQRRVAKHVRVKICYDKRPPSQKSESFLNPMFYILHDIKGEKWVGKKGVRDF